MYRWFTSIYIDGMDGIEYGIESMTLTGDFNVRSHKCWAYLKLCV